MSPAYTWQWDNMVGGWRGDEELVQGHPGTFRTSRNSPMYYSSNDTYLLYAPWPEKPDVAQEAPETAPELQNPPLMACTCSRFLFEARFR